MPLASWNLCLACQQQSAASGSVGSAEYAATVCLSSSEHRSAIACRTANAGHKIWGATTALVDRQNQNVSVACTAADTNTNVAIGDTNGGVGAVVSNDSPQAVHYVGLGTVNGVTLGYAGAAAGQGHASATKPATRTRSLAPPSATTPPANNR